MPHTRLIALSTKIENIASAVQNGVLRNEKGLTPLFKQTCFKIFTLALEQQDKVTLEKLVAELGTMERAIAPFLEVNDFKKSLNDFHFSFVALTGEGRFDALKCRREMGVQVSSKKFKDSYAKIINAGNRAIDRYCILSESAKKELDLQKRLTLIENAILDIEANGVDDDLQNNYTKAFLNVIKKEVTALLEIKNSFLQKYKIVLDGCISELDPTLPLVLRRVEIEKIVLQHRYAEDRVNALPLPQVAAEQAVVEAQIAFVDDTLSKINTVNIQKHEKPYFHFLLTHCRDKLLVMKNRNQEASSCADKIEHEIEKIKAEAANEYVAAHSIDLPGIREARNAFIQLIEKLSLNFEQYQQKYGARGETLLHTAARHNHVDLMRLLIQAGWPVNSLIDVACSLGGFTALHVAALYGHSEALHVLLENGADENIMNPMGATAFDCAVEVAQTNAMRVLYRPTVHCKHLPPAEALPDLSQEMYGDVVETIEDLSRIYALIESETGHLEGSYKRALIQAENISSEALIHAAKTVVSAPHFENASVSADLQYVRVPGDGHCLYHAVGKYLGEGQINLRKRVADYITEHPNEFRDVIGGLEGEQGRDLNTYVQDIRNGKEWADELEISVLMKVFNRPIIIIGPGKVIRNPDAIRLLGDPIFVHYNGVNHYNALIKMNDIISGRDILNKIQQGTVIIKEDVTPKISKHQSLADLTRERPEFAASTSQLNQNQITFFVKAIQGLSQVSEMLDQEKENFEEVYRKPLIKMVKLGFKIEFKPLPASKNTQVIFNIKRDIVNNYQIRIIQNDPMLKRQIIYTQLCSFKSQIPLALTLPHFDKAVITLSPEGNLQLENVKYNGSFIFDIPNKCILKNVQTKFINVEKAGNIYVRYANQLFTEGKCVFGLMTGNARWVNRGYATVDGIKIDCKKQSQYFLPALDNRDGHIQVEKTFEINGEGLNNNRGTILANGIKFKLSGNLQAQGGHIIAIARDVEIDLQGKNEWGTYVLFDLHCKDQGSIRSLNGQLKIKAGNLITDETSLLHGKEKIDLMAQSLSAETAIVSKSVFLAIENVHLGRGIGSRLGNIKVQYNGGILKLGHCVTVGKVLSLALKEGMAISYPLTVQGSLQYQLADSAKAPLIFLADQSASRNFRINDISTALKIGDPKHYVTLSAGKKFSAKVKGHLLQPDLSEVPAENPNAALFANRSCSVVLEHGRIIGVQGIDLQSKADMPLGTLEMSPDPLKRPSALISDGLINLTVENNTADIRLHQLEILGRDLTVKGKRILDNVSSDLKIQKDMILDFPLSRHRILTRKEGGSEQAVTRPAKVILGGKLKISGDIELLASQLSCMQFEGRTPPNAMIKSFIPYTTRMETYLSHQTRIKHSFHSDDVHNHYATRPVVTNGIPIPAVFSIGGELQSQFGMVDISGIVSALAIDLGIKQGRLGHDALSVSLAPIPMKPFRNVISFLEYFEATACYEIVSDGPTIFKSVLPRELVIEAPLLICRADGSLSPNTEMLPRLFTPEQEQTILVKILMSELGRGFLGEGLTDPKTIIDYLKTNTARYHGQGQALVAGKPSVKEPLLAYEEIPFENKGKTRRVVVPKLYLPNNFDNRRLRDGAGCIFALKGISFEGSPGAVLQISCNMETRGLVTFRKFEHLSREKNTYTRYETIMQETTSKNMMGKNKSTVEIQQVPIICLQPGNEIVADGLVMTDVKNIYLSVAKDTYGKEGIRITGADTIIDRAILQNVVGERVVDKKRGLIGGGTVTVHQPVSQNVLGSVFQTEGPVFIQAKKGVFDATRFSTPNGREPMVQFEIPELHFHELLRAIEARDRAHAAALKEAQRTAKRKKKQGLTMMLISLPLSYYLGGLASGWLQGFGIGGVKLAVGRGIAMGMTSSAVQGKNMLKGGLEGGFFAGVGYGIINAPFLKDMPEAFVEATRGMTVGGLSAIIHKQNILENMAIGGISAGVGAAVFPNLDPTQSLPFIQTVSKSVLESAITFGLSKGPAKDLIGNLAMSTFGAAVGSRLSDKGMRQGYHAARSRAAIHEKRERSYQRIASNNPTQTFGSGHESLHLFFTPAYNAGLKARGNFEQQKVAPPKAAKNTKNQPQVFSKKLSGMVQNNHTTQLAALQEPFLIRALNAIMPGAQAMELEVPKNFHVFNTKQHSQAETKRNAEDSSFRKLLGVKDQGKPSSGPYYSIVDDIIQGRTERPMPSGRYLRDNNLLIDSGIIFSGVFLGGLKAAVHLTFDFATGLYTYVNNLGIISDGLVEPFERDQAFHDAWNNNEIIVLGLHHAITNPIEAINIIQVALKAEELKIQTLHDQGDLFKASFRTGEVVINVIGPLSGVASVVRFATSTAIKAARKAAVGTQKVGKHLKTKYKNAYENPLKFDSENGGWLDIADRAHQAYVENTNRGLPALASESKSAKLSSKTSFSAEFKPKFAASEEFLTPPAVHGTNNELLKFSEFTDFIEKHWDLFDVMESAEIEPDVRLRRFMDMANRRSKALMEGHKAKAIKLESRIQRMFNEHKEIIQESINLIFDEEYRSHNLMYYEEYRSQWTADDALKLEQMQSYMKHLNDLFKMGLDSEHRQGVIPFQQLLSSQSVPSSNIGLPMFPEFAEFVERHIWVKYQLRTKSYHNKNIIPEYQLFAEFHLSEDLPDVLLDSLFRLQTLADMETTRTQALLIGNKAKAISLQIRIKNEFNSLKYRFRETLALIFDKEIRSQWTMDDVLIFKKGQSYMKNLNDLSIAEETAKLGCFPNPDFILDQMEYLDRDVFMYKDILKNGPHYQRKLEELFGGGPEKISELVKGMQSTALEFEKRYLKSPDTQLRHWLNVIHRRNKAFLGGNEATTAKFDIYIQSMFKERKHSFTESLDIIFEEKKSNWAADDLLRFDQFQIFMKELGKSPSVKKLTGSGQSLQQQLKPDIDSLVLFRGEKSKLKSLDELSGTLGDREIQKAPSAAIKEAAKQKERLELLLKDNKKFQVVPDPEFIFSFNADLMLSNKAYMNGFQDLKIIRDWAEMIEKRNAAILAGHDIGALVVDSFMKFHLEQHKVIFQDYLKAINEVLKADFDADSALQFECLESCIKQLHNPIKPGKK